MSSPSESLPSHTRSDKAPSTPGNGDLKPDKAAVDALNADKQAKYDKLVAMQVAAGPLHNGCRRNYIDRGRKSQSVKHNGYIQKLYTMKAREQITERGFLTPGEVEWIKVWNSAVENGMLESIEDGLIERFWQTGVFPPPFSPLDAINSVPIKDTRKEDTVEKEDEFVMVNKDGEGANEDEDEDDIVVVEKVEVAKDYVKSKRYNVVFREPKRSITATIDLKLPFITG